MVPKRHASKRLTLRQKHKIERKIIQHHKKARREARKNPKRPSKKDKTIGIPNSFPLKEEMLLQIENEKRIAMEEKAQRKLERKNATAVNTTTTTDSNNTIQIAKPLAAKGKDDSSTVDFMTVIENVDIILEVVDARDPIGTRTKEIEKTIVENEKQLIIVINKIDMVPREIVQQWLEYFNAEFPTVPVKSMTETKSLGIPVLINMFEKFKENNKDNKEFEKKPVTVGVIGFPGVGKYTLIESFRKYHKKECEIKIDNLITLGENITMLDCAGIVFARTNDDNSNLTEIMIRNCVKPKLLEHPEICVQTLLKQCTSDQLCKMFKIPPYLDYNDFLLQVAKSRRLVRLKGNVDIPAIAINVISDFQANRIPHYTCLPKNQEIPKTTSECQKMVKTLGFTKESYEEVLNSIKKKGQFNEKLYVIKGFDYADIDMDIEGYFGEDADMEEIDGDEEDDGEWEEAEEDGEEEEEGDEDEDDDDVPMAVPIDDDE